MKRTVLTLSLIGLTLSCGTLAVSAAETAAPRSGQELTRAEAQAGAEKLFDRLDINHDGKLDSGDRTARVDSLFDRVDTNHDGSISRDEFRAWREDGKGGKGRGQYHGPDDAGTGDNADASQGKPHWGHGNGRGGPGGHEGFWLTKLILHRADPNHTGTVTRAAFIAAALQLFDEADTNHDGKLSGEERAAERARLGYRLREKARARWQAHRQAGTAQGKSGSPTPPEQ